MKNRKSWWILPATLLAVFGLLMTGCPGDGGGGGGGGGDPKPFYHSLASDSAPFTLVLGDNFEYGEGYQGQVKSAKLFEGNKVAKGETFWLDVTFKASRELENALWVGLVDTVTGYWNPLTWDGDDDDDEGGLLAPAGKDETYIVKKDEEVSILIKMVALKTAPNAGTDYNVLNIQTKGDGTKGTSGSGVKKAVTLTFTKFVFARDEAYDATKAPGFVPSPPAPKATIKVNGTDQEVTPLSGKSGDPATLTADKKGFVAISDSYGNDFVYFKVALGTNSLAALKNVTATYTGKSGDTGSKALYLAASKDAFGNYYGLEAMTKTIGRVENATGASTITIGGSWTPWYDKDNGAEKPADNDAAANLTALVTELGDATDVYFLIGIHAGTATYEISDIAFNW
jgi:hypothetical protein